MYVTLLVLLLGTAAWLVYSGLVQGQRLRAGAGLALGIATGLFFGTLSFWGEMLWFQALGYGDRFWIAVVAEGGFLLVGALVAAALVYALLAGVRKTVRGGAALAAAVLGGFWGYESWETLLMFVHREGVGLEEPVFGLDAGFYLFTLPMLDVLQTLLLSIAFVAFGASVFWALTRTMPDLADLQGMAERLGGGRRIVRRDDGNVVILGAPEGNFPLRRPANQDDDGRTLPVVARTLAFLALIVAASRLVAAFHLLFSRWGTVSGPGWTDVYVRLPAFLLTAAALAVAAAVLLVPRFRQRFGLAAERRGVPGPLADLFGLAVPFVGVALLWMLAQGVVPALVQSFVVEPNEISYESRFIAENIRFTRHGFGLQAVEEREFGALGDFSAETAIRNDDLLDETRLWDWRALEAVYEQFQEIRLYYEFLDVDIDRYRIGERTRQVMISARELELDNLPQQSQTFVNRRFKYTHGYGLTLAPVSEFTPQGLPNLLIKDLPPVAVQPELQVERPEIYYGEASESPVYANSSELEFDYPRGDDNALVHYSGRGGVELKNFWRRFVFGWMFDGTRFFLSDYPQDQTRVMFHRSIRERVQRLAPFLTLDTDPYIVLAEGKLYWIVDGYTTSRYFPYSEPFDSREVIDLDGDDGGRPLVSRVLPRFHGSRYLRNSVKAVVDAYDGTVDFYVFEPDDPLVNTWGRVFPGLFKPRAEMPAPLQEHVRYPRDLLLAQGRVYAAYHMGEPEIFYNQEDLWVRATERYYDRVQPVQPYYVMWRPPESVDAGQEVQFTSILPFTPKNRQVLIGWLAGLSDGDNYGRLIAYQFPKQRRILGPQQVETKIDQDRELSQRLTLWDQRGSRVIRGNVLAIPIEETLLYVEPIYLQAETAAYPELRLVVLMHRDDLAYGQSFSEALERLVGATAATREAESAAAEEAALARGETVERPAPEPISDAASTRDQAEIARLAAEADRAFERYLDLQSERRFSEAAQELERLGEILEELAGSGSVE
jgi:uncharacterized membrane protein (UPF0182 family)